MFIGGLTIPPLALTLMVDVDVSLLAGCLPVALDLKLSAASGAGGNI